MEPLIGHSNLSPQSCRVRLTRVFRQRLSSVSSLKDPELHRNVRLCIKYILHLYLFLRTNGLRVLPILRALLQVGKSLG